MPGGGRKDLDDLFQEFITSAPLILGLLVVLGLGLWVVSRIRSRLADDEGSATGDHRLLSQIAELKEQGDLTEEEYRSIKGRLVERLDDSMSAHGGKGPAQTVSKTAEAQPSDAPETREGASTARDALDD